MKAKFWIVGAVALAVVACAKEPQMPAGSLPGGETAAPADAESVLDGWIRIKLQEDTQPLRVGVFTRGEADSGDPELDRIAASLGATEIRRTFGDGGRFAERRRRYGFHLWYDIRFDEDIPVSRAQEGIATLPGVAHVQPVYRIEPLDQGGGVPAEMVYTPAALGASRPLEAPFNDPSLGMQWHYNNPGTMRRSVEGADINLFEAWKTTAGDPAVIVAVMDGGVQWDHPDLAANMWVNEAELNGAEGVDDDGNGYEDDVYGWNTMRWSGELAPNSHGTHVAGTVAAVNNNGIGGCGVAGGTGNGDGVRIMSCQIFDTEESGRGAEAFLYAADNGAVIAQNSWVYRDMTILPKDMSDALDYFIENAGIGPDGEQTGPMRGGIIICSAGNDYSSRLTFPGADDRVIGVTAMMANYVKAAYSNYGTAADIFAPGGSERSDTEFSLDGRVYSTDITDSYGYKGGTSMACPHVSGIAALLISHYGVGKPGFTPDKLREIMLRGYRNVGHYQKTAAIADGLGVGLIDPTLMGVEDPKTPPQAPQAVAAEGTEERKLTLRITASADANNLAVAKYYVSYAPEGTADGASEWKSLELYNRAEIGATSEYTVGNLSHGTTYVFRVKSVDRFGNESTGYTEGRGTTVEHTNLSPEIVKPLARVSLPVNNSFTATVALNEFFTDPDLPDDELTFSAVSNDASIVTARMLEGGILEVTGLKKGDTFVAITVKDREGLSLSKNMGVTVASDPVGGGTNVTLPDSSQSFRSSVALDELFGVTGGMTYAAVSSAPEVVTVEVNGNVLILNAVKMGSASVTVTGTDAAGVSATRTVGVTVTANPGSGEEQPAEGIDLYPNPAVDVVNIRVNGATGGMAGVRIYDAASRLVGNFSVTLDGSGVAARNDVSALAAGAYSVVVEHEGRRYTSNFMKR